MSGRLVVVTGTGTDIGKTHLAEALLLALRAAGRVIGVKPLESGVVPGRESDSERLRRASTFHVKHSTYAFAPPISPHLAARDAGVAIDLTELTRSIDGVRDLADVVLVELPGGLFTPVSDVHSNADLARALRPNSVFLVCPDRLGVLHDVTATLRAATTVPLSIDAVVVVAPLLGDASTGRNAGEIADLLRPPHVGVIPRAEVNELSNHPALLALAARVLSGD